MGRIRKQTFIVEVATDKDSFEDWLNDELKQSYIHAIEDFTEEISEKIMSKIDDCAELQWIDEIAQQLKERE